jgi:predicted PurR-regulated permease PerM
MCRVAGLSSPTVTTPMSRGGLETRVFQFLVIAVSLAFFWILRPYAGAILWGAVLAIVFAPLNRRLRREWRERRTLAALGTMLIVLVLVILPVALITMALVREGADLYARIQSGQLDVGRWFQQLFGALPAWALRLLDRVGLTDLDAIQARLSTGLTRSMQFLAQQALSVGQLTLGFLVDLGVMLYLLFFLLRDGDVLAQRIRSTVPLPAEQQRNLAERFTTVIRATVKGNLVVALVQGALGGLIFWFLGVHAPVLWGVFMALVSLLPAVGAPVVWIPVAVYLLVTGSTWQGILLIVFGALVIGSADNVLRPMLVGKDTKLPDYVVLITTLGGIAVFGANGFVIGPLIAALFVAVWEIVGVNREIDRDGVEPAAAATLPE